MSLFALWRSRRPAMDPGSVYVRERFGVRSLHIGSDTIQSAMRLARPNDLELAYTRSMMAFLLFNDGPLQVLLVGLGGGSLLKFLYHRMRSVRIEAVEINPRVIAAARQHFHVPPDDGRLAVRIGSGAEHVAQAAADADVIMVDGYDGEAQVEELSTRPFYDACRRRLNPGGLLVVNLWSSDRGFNGTLQRIVAAFPAGTLCLPAEKQGNIIVFAFRDAPGNPRWSALGVKACLLEERYGLEFDKFLGGLREMNRCDGERLYV